MKKIIVGILAIALVLLTASYASAAYSYLTPVNPGSVAYAGYYCPSGMTYTSPAYAAYYTYPLAVGRFAARPIVASVPMAAQPVIGPYPTVVARPMITVPTTVVYPVPVVVQPRVCVPGQPVRNVLRGAMP